MRHAVRRSNLLPLAEAAGPDGTGGASSRETGPKPQRWLPQEAPLFTTDITHNYSRSLLPARKPAASKVRS